jgi:molybdenum cofactor biosynthesis enzyme MoaA
MVATARDQDSNIARGLRLSITGECNLNCFYCRTLGEARDLFSTKTPIQSSDVTKLVRIVGEMGVNKVVIQGGEPLLRKDAANFIKAAYAHKSIQDVRLVTNGTFLKAFADSLRKMGLRKVDINFDSLSFMKYQRITGRDSLYRVLDGIEKLEKLNFPSIRLNVRLLNEINENELIDFARMTKDRPLHVRFIEYYPRSASPDPYAQRLGLSVLGVKRAIDNFQSLVRADDMEVEDEILVPSYKFADGVGRISFLSQMEVEAEEGIPRVLFNVEGVLINELAPNRPQPILADLRRDAKEDRLHKVIQKVMTQHATEVKKPAKPPSKTAIAAAMKAKSRTQTYARR